MKKTAIIIILIMTFSGCTILSRSYKLGTEASINKNWDEAVEHYERAVLEDPENSVLRSNFPKEQNLTEPHQL